MNEVLQVAADAAAVFERLGAPYVLAGGVASILYGEPRSTLDVDFAVHMTATQAARLPELCAGLFLVDREFALSAVRDLSMFAMVHARTYTKVDVHVRPRTGLHREEIERGRWLRLGPGHPDDVRVATPEDVILQKLRWYEAGGRQSSVQWRDVLGIAKLRHHSLDWDYLDRWARELRLGDLLASLRCECGLGP